MNNRIGIMTFFYKNRNYGGLLQAYALQKSIYNIIDNCECEQISYRLSTTPIKRKISNAIKYMTIIDIFKMVLWEMCLKRIVGKFSNNYVQRLTQGRLNAFEKFEEGIPHSKEIYDYKTIKNSIGKYDIYVVGSDQIWNAGIDLESFLLKFAPENVRKVSYAASSGGIVFKGIQKEVFTECLSCFDAISVREKSLAQQLRTLGDFTIESVIDPVFLLSKKEWNDIVHVPQIDEPYIMCYLLGTSKKQRVIVEEICKARGFKLLVFPYIINNAFRLCDWKFGDIRDYHSGPEQFLGLVKNAQAIITDSFHAVAFSVIFNKNFCVFPRYENGKKSKSNNRIFDFLRHIQIEDRVAESKKEALLVLDKSIDYNNVCSCVDNWVVKSKMWLQVALNGIIEK